MKRNLTGRLGWLMSVTFAGLIVPPVIIAADGLRSALNSTPRSSPQRLADAIRDSLPLIERSEYDTSGWVYDAARKCGYPIRINGDASVDEETILEAVAVDAGWRSYKLSTEAIYKNRLLEESTSPFFRTLVADCLSMPIYNVFCHRYGEKLLHDVDRDYAKSPAPIEREHALVFEHAICSVFKRSS